MLVADARREVRTTDEGGFFIFPITTGVPALLHRPHALSADNPSVMVLAGAHYLPFATFYGMKSFLALSALVVAGIGIACLAPGDFGIGAWVTSAVLFAFAFIGRVEAARAADRGPEDTRLAHRGPAAALGE